MGGSEDAFFSILLNPSPASNPESASERGRPGDHLADELNDAIAHLVAVFVQPAPDRVVRPSLDLEHLDTAIARLLQRLRSLGILRAAPLVVAIGVEQEDRRNVRGEMMGGRGIGPRL